MPRPLAFRALRLGALVFILSLSLALLKAAQGGIFLAAFGREMIPWAFSASAITLATLSSLSVALAAKLGPPRLALLSLLTSAAGIALLRALLMSSGGWVPFAVYVVIEALSGVLIIQVWNVVSESVDARSAKKILPLVGTGGSVAWILGGVVVPLLVRAVGAPGLLVITPGLLLIAAALVMVIAKLDAREGAGGDRRMKLIDGWKQGFRAVRTIPLLRLSAALSVLALVNEEILDYLLMSSLRAELGDASAISVFFGRYYGATSVVSLVLLLGVSERLLTTIGSSRVLALGPAVTTIGAVIAAASPALGPIVGLRATDRVLKQSFWSPGMEQTLTPLPSIARAQSRALTRGVIAPLAYAVVGVGLAMVPKGTSLRYFAVLAAALAFASMILVIVELRARYLGALRSALDVRRIDLTEPGEAGHVRLDADAVSMLAAEVMSTDPERAGLAVELLRSLPGDDGVVALSTALQHEDRAVRAAAIEALGTIGSSAALDGLIDRMTPGREPDVALLRSCAAIVFRSRSESPRAHDALVALAKSDDEVARKIGRLKELHDQSDLAEQQIASMVRSADLVLRNTALDALTPSNASGAEVCSALRDVVSGGDERARIEVVAAIARVRVESLVPDLEPLISDPRTVSSVLGACSPWPEVQSELIGRALSVSHGAIRERVARSVARAMIDGSIAPLAREIVEPLLNEQIARSHKLNVIMGGVAHDDGKVDWEFEPAYQYLGGEIELEIREGQRHILHLLRFWESGRLLRAIELGLGKPSAALLARVAELIEVSIEPALAAKIAPLFEALPLRERVTAAKKLGLLSKSWFDDPLTALVELNDRHLVGAALIAYGTRFEARYPKLYEEMSEMIPLFERMRVLRTVPLFAELSGEDLRTLAEIMTPAEVAAGEVLFREGDRGDDLFVVVDGLLSIREGTRELSRVGARELLGELAVLDSEPRSADAVCVEHAHLLRLRGVDLAELMARRPQIQEKILLVVVRRLRALSKKFAGS